MTKEEQVLESEVEVLSSGEEQESPKTKSNFPKGTKTEKKKVTKKAIESDDAVSDGDENVKKSKTGNPSKSKKKVVKKEEKMSGSSDSDEESEDDDEPKISSKSKGGKFNILDCTIHLEFFREEKK